MIIVNAGFVCRRLPGRKHNKRTPAFRAKNVQWIRLPGFNNPADDPPAIRKEIMKHAPVKAEGYLPWCITGYAWIAGGARDLLAFEEWLDNQKRKYPHGIDPDVIVDMREAWLASRNAMCPAIGKGG